MGREGAADFKMASLATPVAETEITATVVTSNPAETNTRSQVRRQGTMHMIKSSGNVTGSQKMVDIDPDVLFDHTDKDGSGHIDKKEFAILHKVIVAETRADIEREKELHRDATEQRKQSKPCPPPALLCTLSHISFAACSRSTSTSALRDTPFSHAPYNRGREDVHENLVCPRLLGAPHHWDECWPDVRGRDNDTAT